MSFTKEVIKEAYIKLKSYVYYDNTDLILRKKLVEFETGIGKEFITNNPNSHYNINSDSIFNNKYHFTLDEKFERIAFELNSYHEDSKFFDALFKKVHINYYPKKIKSKKEEKNFISNIRVQDSYELERLTPFINAPIELHIISVLWIIEEGVRLDTKLKDECLGNRLLLNKDKSKLVQGSGLFKPYFTEYQKWRDEPVEVAESILKKGKNVAFISLDIKDYFTSVRISREKLFNKRKYRNLNEYYNLREIFLNIHDIYSKQLSSNHKYPNDFYSELLNPDGSFDKVVLPIGLLSSYVLANDYLHEFDQQIINSIKPAYYGRYVDDMIFVVSDPNLNLENNRFLKDLGELNKYELTSLEKFVLNTFYPIINITTNDKSTSINSNLFVLGNYKSLFCQSEKSLVHFFDADESHLVIDKLKQELDEKTSEFRDFPEEAENDLSFQSSAYHLEYDGTEGKIRTLKDYKENRFGLTVFLSNKIFSALRHENNLSDSECDEIIKFFKGEICITFYRLWEKILALLLVNNKPQHYVVFMLHCIEEVKKIRFKNGNSFLDERNVKSTLMKYLDVAHEINLSLNLNFIKSTKESARNFEFKLNELKTNNEAFLFDRFELTKPDSYWVRRFRTCNMMRHHYVIHPLLTYTKASKNGSLKNLTTVNIDFRKYSLDENLVKESPRRVKFWECCMSVSFELIGTHGKKLEREINGKVITNIFGLNHQKKNEDEFYLDDAFERYKEINDHHLPDYELNNELKNQIFRRKNQVKKNSPIVNTQEIIIGNKNRESKTFKIAFANTKVDVNNIIASMRGTPNLSSNRYDQIAKIVKKVRLDDSDILLFPEFFIPINLLSSIVKYSEKNQVLTLVGLEHIKIKNTVFNFIVTILPFELNGIKDSVVVFRLKNHYAHIEDSLIRGNHLKVATPKTYRYDIFNWENLYFCPYYCFELANVWHRSLFKSKLDLLIGVEWNKDTNYFSNIIESCSRDLHCYIAQVNTSQFGDSRLTQPVESARKDILKLKGGTNDSILVAEINLKTIREFQRKTFDLTHKEKEFKPLPPDYEVSNVIKRINNESVL
jgi:hypothetical protein